MTKICLTGPFQEKYKTKLLEEFSSKCDLVFTTNNDLDNLVTSDVIVGNPIVDTLLKCTNLKLLQTCSAGVDPYTENPNFPSNVTLCHVTGVFGVCISEYIIGAILSIYHNFYRYHQQQPTHVWKDLGADDNMANKNVLILGTGDIGMNTALHCKNLFAKTIGLNSTGHEVEGFDKVDCLDNIDLYLPQTDIMICCLPANKKTIDFISFERLNKIKDGAIIVNIGRGKLFQEGVIEKITEIDGKINAFISDVFRTEPLPADSVLWDRKNVYITPHISGKGFTHNDFTENKIYENVRNNIENYLNNSPLNGVIDMK